MRRSNREVLAQLPHALRWLWEASRGGTLLLCAVTAVMGVLPAVMAWFGRQIIDSAAAAATAQTEAARQQVLVFVGIEASLALSMLFCRRAQTYLRAMLRAKLGNLLGVRMLEKALSLELEQFERSQTYDLLQNARRDVSTRPISLALSGLLLARSLVTLVSLGFILWDIAWWSVIPLALSVIPEFFIETRLSGEAFALSTGRAQDSRRLGYYESMLTLDSHVKEVKLYGLGPLVLGRYRDLFSRFFREDDRLGRRQLVLGTVFAGLSSLAFYVCYAAVAWRTALGLLSIGGLTLAVVAFRQGQGAVEDVLSSLTSLYDDALYVSNLSRFFELPAAGQVTTPARAATRVLPPGRFSIELDHVSFRYPGQGHDALHDLSLTLRPGEKLAIVGENGAGKSTLIKLLLRLYEPTAGVIRFGGIDVRELDAAELRKRLGAVFQDFVRYQLSAGENIGLGDLARLESADAVAAAARAGGAEGLLAELPQGTGTVLGNWFENGHELSGGQWQRLAIARSFMRLSSEGGEGADLLILDEPTAAIDAAAEVALFERFRQLTEGRSAIIISHRFSTVRMADRIAVLEHGKLIELGSHDALLANDGQYARLFQLQARGYR